VKAHESGADVKKQQADNSLQMLEVGITIGQLNTVIDRLNAAFRQVSDSEGWVNKSDDGS
jgi:hypothetical protein